MTAMFPGRGKKHHSGDAEENHYRKIFLEWGGTGHPSSERERQVPGGRGAPSSRGTSSGFDREERVAPISRRGRKKLLVKRKRKGNDLFQGEKRGAAHPFSEKKEGKKVAVIQSYLPDARRQEEKREGKKTSPFHLLFSGKAPAVSFNGNRKKALAVSCGG